MIERNVRGDIPLAQESEFGIDLVLFAKGDVLHIPPSPYPSPQRGEEKSLFYPSPQRGEGKSLFLVSPTIIRLEPNLKYFSINPPSRQVMGMIRQRRIIRSFGSKTGGGIMQLGDDFLF